ANLLRNAGRYSRANGAVELELAAEGRDLVVRVADAGPGPLPERLASFFEKMRKAEGDPRGGLGLGLAICRGIAEAHGGNIRAISRPGRFIVEARFPACAEPAAEEG
ncbi:MAG: sensor histidine kinase, partial [Spirochaetaceae bacterium]|nr:sensor histidine kinase [Spirochaetaceae bacterium]